MEKRIVKLICIVLCVLGTSFAYGGEKQWVKLGNGFAAEKIDHVEPADLWHSTNGNTYRSSDGLVVGFWPIDPESANRNGEWIMVGLLLSGLGDIAETPVAVRLWSNKQLSFGVVETAGYEKKHQKAALFFYPAECTDPAKCAQKLTAVVLKLNGPAEVLINNKNFGAIK